MLPNTIIQLAKCNPTKLLIQSLQYNKSHISKKNITKSQKQKILPKNIIKKQY